MLGLRVARSALPTLPLPLVTAAAVQRKQAKAVKVRGLVSTAGRLQGRARAVQLQVLEADQ